MSKTFFGKNVGSLVVLIALIVTFGFAFLGSATKAEAANGDITVNVSTEISTPLSGAYVEIQCSGGSYVGIGSTDGSGNVTALAAELGDASGGTAYAAADCDFNGEPISVRASKSGYIDHSTSGSYATGSGNTYNITGFEFSLRVSPTREIANDVLSGATVTAGSGNTACVEDGSTGVYYCPVPEGQDGTITVSKTGYVTNTDQSTGSIDTDSQEQVDVPDVLFQVKICLADELGHTNGFSVGTLTFDGHAPNTSASNCTYYPNTGSNKAVVLTASGFIANATTNTGLSDVSTSPSSQTYIELGDYSTRSSAITTGETDIKGFEYKLKSQVLKSEIGGAVTDIASGYGSTASPSADLTIGGTGTITSSAVSGDVIYIAGTWPGEGTDTVTLRLSNVTADSGTSDDGANFVTATLTDGSSYLSGLTSQATFSVGQSAGNIYVTQGFLYPLKVVAADELGTAISPTDLTTTLGGTAYYRKTSTSTYFGNYGSNQSLVINAAGYVHNASTNTGLTDVTTNQTTQTVVVLDTSATRSSALTAGSTYNIKGLQYVLKSGVLKSEIGGSVTNIAAGSADGGDFGNVSVAGVSGVSIVRTVMSGGNLYIAATGSGEGSDQLTVQVSGIDVDSGTNGDLVKATLSDESNYIYNATAQKIFDIGSGGSGDLVTGGFKYPLKVTIADQFGSTIGEGAGDVTSTYNGVAPFYITGNDAYFATTSSSATLSIAKDGYVNTEITNTGFTDVTTDQNEQAVITLGNEDQISHAIIPGDDVVAIGLELGQHMTITDELGNALYPDTVTAGSGNTNCILNEEGVYCAVPVAEDGGIGDIAIDKAGFIRKTASSTNRTSGTSPQAHILVSGVQYAMKVTAITDELGHDIMPTGEASPFSFSADGSTLLSQVYSDGAWYLAVVDGNGEGGPGTNPAYLQASVSGYVTAQSAEDVFPGSSQELIDFSTATTGNDYDEGGLKFPLRVNVYNELNQGLNIGEGAAWVYFGESSPAYVDGNGAYFNVTGTGQISAGSDGYVNLDTNSVDTGLSSITSTDAYQTSIDLMGTTRNTDGDTGSHNLTGSGLKYALKVTARENWETSDVHQLISGATVTVGDSFDTTCSEGGEGSGTYYCALSTSDDGITAKLVRSGYTTGYANYPDRNSDSDPQSVITAFLGIPGDTSYPSVSSSYPENMGEGLSVNTHPYVIFSKEMDSSTATSGSIYLEYGEGSRVAATVQMSEGNRRATIIPDAPLSYNQTYYFVVGSYVTDLVGQTLGEGSISNQFSTESSGGYPSVSSTNPTDGATGVSVNVNPTVTFNKAINPSYLTDSYITLTPNCECESIPVSIQALNGNTKARIVTDEPLTAGTEYRIDVSSSLQDTYGVSMGEGSSAYFTTAAAETGTLAVTGVSAVKTYATADNTYENGFAWILNVTVPSDEHYVKLKLSDFVSGSNSITASNVRYCTAQGDKDCDSSAEDSTDYIYLTAANTYPDGDINTSTDLDSATAGRQIQVRVEMKVPSSTPGGSYSGSYGLLTNEPV